MQRDVKVGLIIGVIILAVIVVFWTKHESSSRNPVGTVVSPENSNVTFENTGLTSTDSAIVEETGAPGTTTTTLGQGRVAPPAGGGAIGAVAGGGNAPPPARADGIIARHKLQRGETVYALAKKYYNDVSPSKQKLILDANHIADPKLLRPDQVLVIPALPADSRATLQVPAGRVTQPPPLPRAAAATHHKVQKGDTVYALAKKYYGDPSPANQKRILDANKIADATQLRIGQDIVIPPAQ